MSPLFPFQKKKLPAARVAVQTEAEEPVRREPLREQGAGIVLAAPHVTEKAGRLEALHQYTFRVSPRAKKSHVAEAIAAIYGVKPMRVQMLNLPAKTRRRGRFVGQKTGVRKAIVTLPKGKTIEVFPK